MFVVKFKPLLAVSFRILEENINVHNYMRYYISVQRKMETS